MPGARGRWCLPARGEMVRKDQGGLVGLEWGILAALARGGGVVGLPGFCCCLGRAQPRDSYPVQKQNWFLDWQLAVPRGQGQKEAKRSGGQWHA